MSKSQIIYATLMLVSGIGIPLMATLNAGLGQKLQNPALATTISFLGSVIFAFSYLILFQGTAMVFPKNPIPIYYYLGGIFLTFYVLSIAWVAPRFGLGNSIVFVLVGQLIAITAIDHYGLLGALQTSFSVQRLVGLSLMAIGAMLVTHRF